MGHRAAADRVDDRVGAQMMDDLEEDMAELVMVGQRWPDFCTTADHISLWRREPVLASKVRTVSRWINVEDRSKKGMYIMLTNGKQLDIPEDQWLTDICIARIALEAS